MKVDHAAGAFAIWGRRKWEMENGKWDGAASPAR